MQRINIPAVFCIYSQLKPYEIQTDFYDTLIADNMSRVDSNLKIGTR